MKLENGVIIVAKKNMKCRKKLNFNLRAEGNDYNYTKDNIEISWPQPVLDNRGR